VQKNKNKDWAASSKEVGLLPQAPPAPADGGIVAKVAATSVKVSSKIRGKGGENEKDVCRDKIKRERSTEIVWMVVTKIA
jgi:hypothetical protein